MQTEVLKAIVQAFNCASEDETRYHLCAVLVTAKTNPSTVVIEATDGHVLSRVEIADDFALDIGEHRLLVMRDQLPALKIILKSHKRIPVPASWINGRLVIGVQEVSGCQVEIKTDKEHGLKYPDLNQLWPKQERKWRIGIDPELLTALHKAMQDGNGHTKNVIIEGYDEISPLVIKCGDNKGILMPVRLPK